MPARVDVVVETPYPLAGDACLSMDGPSGAVRDQNDGSRRVTCPPTPGRSRFIQAFPLERFLQLLRPARCQAVPSLTDSSRVETMSWGRSRSDVGRARDTSS